VIKIYFVLAFTKKLLHAPQQEQEGAKNLSISSNPLSIKILLCPAETSSNPSMPASSTLPPVE
jgi:hypothetical protein